MSESTCGSIFDDIVVAVNFTFPHYEAIEFLRHLYGFPRIIFYGPLGVSDDRVIPCDVHQGYFSYRNFHDAFARFDARGVMMVHDDFLLNRWNFESLDINKVWSQPWQQGRLATWPWWRKSIGAPALTAASNALKRKIQSIVFGFSDLMYIPLKMADRLLPILSVYSAHSVFVELAWPNLINTYVYPEERQFLNTVNHVLHEHGHTEWQRLYTKALHGIHPVKWSNPANKADAVRLIAEQP